MWRTLLFRVLLFFEVLLRDNGNSELTECYESLPSDVFRLF